MFYIYIYIYLCKLPGISDKLPYMLYTSTNIHGVSQKT